jgi:hypothetical protein
MLELFFCSEPTVILLYNTIRYTRQFRFLCQSWQRCPSFQVINIEESLAVLTRCSFDESHRQPIFLLGGIPALAEIIQVPLL